MRITEHRMMELATRNVTDLRTRVAASGQQLSTGERVSTPSIDPGDWTASRRADAARVINAGRGEALGRSQEQLLRVDDALREMADGLSQARELALHAATDTMSPGDRLEIQAEVHVLRQSILAAANVRSEDGQYLLAGSRSDQPAFDADGVFQGDDLLRSIEARDGLEQEVGVAGTVLTAASGVDIFAELAALENALGANDRAGILSSADAMQSGYNQINIARADAGAQSDALLLAQEAQLKLDDSLVALHNRLIGADPIEAASDLAFHSSALETAQLVASRIAELTRP